MSQRINSIASAGVVTASALLLFKEHQKDAASSRLAASALETLLNAIDANDAATGAHVRRVAAYALVLADAAELDADCIRLVEQVALFHDIGKIHEALFDIIHDARKLTPAERRAIATHPQKGADVLQPLMGFYPNLPDGVLSHHEWWNGKGYPRKLKGRRIPIAARVVAIADSFDAITFTRPYHKGKSVDFAKTVILEGRGTQFDPELVDLFAMPGVFEEICETEREVSRWKTVPGRRQRRREENHIPEILFRWRPEEGRKGSRK